jgi:Cu-processing system permease protein
MISPISSPRIRAIEFGTVSTLVFKELRDAIRNRWLALYAFAFAGLALALSWTAMSGLEGYGMAGFSRTAAALINLVLLIVPLMGLTLGAMSLAGERERGSLAYLLAQPVTIAEVMLGKFIGLGVTLAAALAFGFGISGMVIAWRGSSASGGDYLELVGLTLMLALATLSIGFLISAGSRRGATAIGIALFAWLGLAFISDLGLMETAIVLDIEINTLFTLSLLNPLQVFNMAAVLSMRGDLEVLGPAGIYAVRAYGDGLLPMLLGVLAAWTAVPLALSYVIFRRKGGL